MKKGLRKYVILSALVVLLVLGFFAFIYYLSNRSTSYSFSEKSWINNNTNNVIDVTVEGSLPLFSNNGEGVFYDFIHALEKDTNLTFNVSVNSNASYSFNNRNYVNGTDIIFYTDHYVVVSTTNERLTSLDNLGNQSIGVLSKDYDYVKKYLDVELKEYENYTTMINDDSILYMVLPLNKYINEIMTSKYNIVYHLEGIPTYYVLSLNSENSILNSIFSKFYNKYKDNIESKVNEHMLNLYYKTYGISDLDKETINSDDLIVGYIDNMPIEGKVNGNFSGVANEYLTVFGDMTGATYKYIKYKNLDSLISALNDRKVDIVYNYYNIQNGNYDNVNVIGNIEYVILNHVSNSDIYESINNINGKSVKMVNNTMLYNYIRDLNINVITFDNYDLLLDNLSDDDILIVERSTYEFYKNSDLKDYIVKYTSLSNVNNKFLINNENKVLSNIFNFYISTLGSKKLDNMAINTSIKDASKNVVLEFILSNIIYILAIGVAVFFLVFKLNKRVKVTKKIKKEDKLMYLDVMTNLKNRNYLNDNLKYWESNKIYPQSVVVVDLNDIAIINDTKGHEEGDKQIIAAAGTLINTQRENTEIVRTDGNEFLIYMVGYDEKQVVTYVNKLVKEFKNLPYEYGASVGYFMITSESTTIDDAINEALIMMRKNKGD